MSIPEDQRLGKWTAHRLRAVQVADILYDLSAQSDDLYRQYFSRARRMGQCATTLTVSRCKTCGKIERIMTMRCRDRLCPVCQWRLSLNRYAEALMCNEHILASAGYLRVVHCVLTVRNVRGCDLQASVDQLLSAWRLLTKRRPWQEWVIGYARSVEITRKSRGYHPHIHALLYMRQDYNRQITTRQLSEWWRESLRLPEGADAVVWLKYAYQLGKDDDAAQDPNVDLRKLTKAVAEATKYVLKSDLLSSASHDEIVAIDTAIKGKRIVEYGGIVKEARAALGLTSSTRDTDQIEALLPPKSPCCQSPEVIEQTMLWATSEYRYADPIDLQRAQLQRVEARIKGR